MRRNAARWAAKHSTDCIAGVLSGRAEPGRGGRHQHSLRDLDLNEDGASAAGPQAAAPLVEVGLPPLYDEDAPFVLRAVSAVDNEERRALGLPPLARPGADPPIPRTGAALREGMEPAAGPRAVYRLQPEEAPPQEPLEPEAGPCTVFRLRPEEAAALIGRGVAPLPPEATPVRIIPARRPQRPRPPKPVAPTTMERPEDTDPDPQRAPDWPGIAVDLLSGICRVKASCSATAAALAPADAAVRAAVERVQELAGGVGSADVAMAPAVVAILRQALVGGGVWPAGVALAPKAVAMLRRTLAGAASTAADAEKIDAYRLNLVADGDDGDAAAHRREHCPYLDLTPTPFFHACRAVAEHVAEAAAAEVRLWPYPGLADGGAIGRDALDAALLTAIRRDPRPGERSLARALAAVGGTQGRVWRRLQRHNLETATKRLRWVLSEAATRMAEAAGAPGLTALYRYHLAAAWCLQREGLPVPRVLPAASEPAEAV